MQCQNCCFAVPLYAEQRLFLVMIGCAFLPALFSDVAWMSAGSQIVKSSSPAFSSAFLFDPLFTILFLECSSRLRSGIAATLVLL